MATPYDPQLHAIRSVARATDDTRLRAEIETARFHLFAALDRDDDVAARQWARAVRVSLEVLQGSDQTWPEARTSIGAALDALAEIETGLATPEEA